MTRLQLAIGVSLSVILTVICGKQAHALPGQTADEATAWVKAHPTLKPASGESLLVRKSSTPAQRFIFLASPFQVGKASPSPTAGVIRTEELSLFDMINGVNPNRLRESLRVIYGPTIYQDYSQARIVYAYPDRATLARATNRDRPLLANLQGELREGNRYGYWLEIATNPQGVDYTGRIIVFLREDLPKIETELRNR